MSDPRLTPDPAKVTESVPREIAVPVCDLLRTPDGKRDRQLLMGASVTLLSAQDGWAYVQSTRDNYVGYLRADALCAPTCPSHRVAAPCTHIYSAPDLKSSEVMALSHQSRIAVTGEAGSFMETALGFVPQVHLRPVADLDQDPATVATFYLGTDYLWGGNSRWGIDCSGLVQAALQSCGIACPGDSDLQQTLGQEAAAPYQRNDLLFWKGHVALVSDPETMIHANAHAMAVTHEPIAAAIARISAAGDGPVIAHRRF